jgi:SAM-dependent methyltransferase
MPDPRKESLDEIVSRRAVVLADQIQKAVDWATSEMDLQVEVSGALKEFAREAKINPLELRHNVTIATGRADSVWGGVVIEYKAPKTLSSQKDAAPNKAVIEQLKRRFYDLNREEKRQWPSMFGVGTDGKYLIFLRFRDEKWTDEEPLEVNRHSAERFLWALYNLGQKGKPYQPEYLHGDFGAESELAKTGVKTLYEEIRKTDNPRAQVFFNQWKILFGEVCGYDVENLSDKLKKLAEFYSVPGKPQPAALLFALHTYYAILIKLLAAEIVSFFNPWMTRQVERLLNATTPTKLKRELEELERGGIFHTMGITNFLEGDLFSWYLAVWSEDIEKAARRMIGKLDEYNPGTFSEDPAQSRDLLKKLYQQLFPKSVRHDLGEYYTPDWLAEHVLNELGYEGDPDKRVLDPACGSGTFLVMAINRIRRWYDANREKCAYDEGDLLKKILTNVVGFDLNPLAVMAARTNYLVAIKDLIRHVDQVEIPIYLCDSIMTPAEYGDLFTGGGNVAKVPCSAVKPPHLLVPKEIAQNPREIARYAAVLEECIKNAYSPDDFLARCRDEGLSITATPMHLELYRELVRLDKANKNGIWARIIKNNFAPLFVRRVDYVAGNPPWINWESLPEEYRRTTLPAWDYYGLRPEKGQLGKMLGGKKDLSMLFVYCSFDNYLRDGGRLGFVITQTVFKTKGAGDGFRQFRFTQNGTTVVLRPLSVHDLSSMHVFEGAANRTALLIGQRQSAKFSYPVPYILWHGPSTVSQDEPLAHVLGMVRREPLAALPVEPSRPTSPWLTCSPSTLKGIRRVMGKSKYAARAGVYTGGLNGCYWVRVLDKRPGGQLLVENLSDVGKIKLAAVKTVIEPDLVYPLLRGRDVSRWSAKSSCFIIAPQDPVKQREGISESEMKRKFPKTYSFLKQFEGQLSARRDRKYYPEGSAFYTIRNMAPYVQAPWKVAWRDMGSEIQVAVVGQGQDGKATCPEHHVMYVPCKTASEAHYLCAVLMSSPVQILVSGYTTSTGISTHVLEHVAVPTFKPKERTHIMLVELSEKCHAEASKVDTRSLISLEQQVDEVAAKLWGIPADELKSIQEAQADARSGRERVLQPADEE